MSGIRAVVRNGRLVVADEGDDLSVADRTALNVAIENACASLDAGKGLRADQVIARLRRKI